MLAQLQRSECKSHRPSPDRLLGFSCFSFKLRDHKNSHTKLTDPQLMKENKVTYPRESRIAGCIKQSNMAEEAVLVGWGLMARACRPCLIMENDSAWAWVFLWLLSALEGGSFYNPHTHYLVPASWMNKGETICGIGGIGRHIWFKLRCRKA